MFGLRTLGIYSFGILKLLGRRRDKSRRGIAKPHGALSERWRWMPAGSAIYVGLRRPQKGPLGISMRTRVRQPINRKKQSWGKCTGQEGLS